MADELTDDVAVAVGAAFGRRPERKSDVREAGDARSGSEQQPVDFEVDIDVALAFGRISAAQAAQARARLGDRVSESAATLTGGRVRLSEATSVRPTALTGRRILVTLITPGLGSSGWYPAETLEAAARDKVFPAGLLLFLDHPTAREAQERPERSVRDLAAVLATDARWTGSALVAEADVLPQHAELVKSLEGVAGMSIRAQAETEVVDLNGQPVRKVAKLLAAESCDFVTKAGRGGFYQVIESGRPRWGG